MKVKFDPRVQQQVDGKLQIENTNFFFNQFLGND